MSRFTNKVAVITGGTSGIGLSTARMLVEEGAKVVVFARSADSIAETVKALGPRGHGIKGDVTRPEDLTRLFAETRKHFGQVDILFANAALAKLAPIADTSAVLFNDIIDVNMRGVFNTVQQSLAHLNDGASVIVASSFLNRIGFAGASALSMTKAAIRSLVRVAAAELAPRGIRVNAVCPGAIETPLWGKLGLPEDTLKAAGAAITAQIPLKRWGKADEVARAVLFLASADASYVNGIELPVDGGFRQT